MNGDLIDVGEQQAGLSLRVPALKACLQEEQVRLSQMQDDWEQIRKLSLLRYTVVSLEILRTQGPA